MYCLYIDYFLVSVYCYIQPIVGGDYGYMAQVSAASEHIDKFCCLSRLYGGGT